MISVHSKPIPSLVAGGAALLLAVLTPAAAPAATTTVTCTPTKVKIVTSDLSSFTASKTFVHISEAALSFTQGGASASCVIVRFSAMTFAFDSTVIIRAYLDNTTTVALPAAVQYSHNDVGAAGAHSFEFVFPRVAPGNHIVHMQFKSADGKTVGVNPHNTVVQFAP